LIQAAVANGSSLAAATALVKDKLNLPDSFDVLNVDPIAQVNSVYRCGLEYGQVAPDQLASVRMALDEAGQSLYAKVLIDLPRPLSTVLMPDTPAADASAAVQAVQS
jgi:hypothetical protein